MNKEKNDEKKVTINSSNKSLSNLSIGSNTRRLPRPSRSPYPSSFHSNSLEIITFNDWDDDANKDFSILTFNEKDLDDTNVSKIAINGEINETTPILFRNSNIIPSSPYPILRNESYSWSDYKPELMVLLKYSFPIVLSEVLRNTLTLMAIIFVGHTTATELAAVALGNSYCTVTGWSLLIGLDSALDTLCAQAYTMAKNAEEKKIIGKIIQRGFVILVCFAVIIGGVWEYTEPILILFHQDPTIAKLTSKFTKFERLGLIPYIIFECEKKMLQVQGIMFAPLYVILIALPVDALLHYFFIYSSWSPLPAEIAYIGSPISVALTFTLMSILGFLYIKYINGKECWGGIDLKCITHSWGEFLKLGIPGAVMISSEWWAYEVCSFMAGVLGEIPLAAQSIFSSITNYSYNIPMGIATASTLRIGNNLGARKSQKAHIASNIALVLAFIFGSLNSLVLLVFRKSLPKVFSNNSEVVQLCSGIMIIGALYQLSDGIACVGNGILRGCGRQKIGAYINFIGYWVIGLPLSYLLCFYFGWNLNGIWLGMAIALVLVSGMELYKIFKFNWSKEVCNAVERFNSNVAAKPKKKTIRPNYINYNNNNSRKEIQTYSSIYSSSSNSSCSTMLSKSLNSNGSSNKKKYDIDFKRQNSKSNTNNNINSKVNGKATNVKPNIKPNINKPVNRKLNSNSNLPSKTNLLNSIVSLSDTESEVSSTTDVNDSDNLSINNKNRKYIKN